MGMALAHKRGELPDASEEVRRLATSMSEKDLEDFASTKHDGLPKKKKADYGVMVTDPVTGEIKEARLHPYEEVVLDEFHRKAAACGMTVEEMTRSFITACALRDE